MKLLIALAAAFAVNAAQAQIFEMDDLELNLKQTTAEPEVKECRQAIVDARSSLKDPIDADAFSSNTFADFNMTPADFNRLSSEEQAEIYMKVKPLEVMIEETVDSLSQNISYLTEDYFMAYFNAELIDDLRLRRDELRICTK